MQVYSAVHCSVTEELWSTHHLSYSREPVMRLDCQILLKSPSLTLLAGSAPADWPYWHVVFPVFLFVISGFCLLFRWMLFLTESLSSMWKYFFFVRIHCSVYVIYSLLAANCMCSWEPYSFDCKRRLLKFFHHFMRLTITVAYIFNFFTVSKGIDDPQSFHGYVLSTKLFFRIRFSSATRAHPSQ